MGVLEVFFDGGKLGNLGAGLGDGVAIDGNFRLNVKGFGDVLADLFEHAVAFFCGIDGFVFRVGDQVFRPLIEQQVGGTGQCGDDHNESNGSGDGAGVGLHGRC